MKIAIIGRSEILYDTAIKLDRAGFDLACIITAKEAPEYTRKVSDFKNLAKKLNIPLKEAVNIDKQKNFLCDLYADIAVSVNFPGVISKSIIDIFPHGILNAHGGDLPKYRGNACQAWAILNGENRIGLCIHSMVGGEIDSGNIIDRKYFKIDHNTKIKECLEWIKQNTPLMFLNSIKKLKKNPSYFLKKQSKNNRNILRCYPRNSEDGKINWNKSNLNILRLINASNKPYSGAYTIFNNKKLIIWDAELLADEENYLSEVGQVAKIERNGSIIIITGKGKLKINKVEYNGLINKPGNIIKSIRNRLK
jgi:methionyl-tRNA formyltransferase